MSEQHHDAGNPRYKTVKPIQILITPDDEKLLNDLASELQTAHRGHKSVSRAARHIIAVYRRLSQELRHAALMAHEDV